MLSAFGNAFRSPDLRKKILFTLFMLAVFRLGSVVPTPNVDLAQIEVCRTQAEAGEQAGLYSLVNLFSGGALLHLSILLV